MSFRCISPFSTCRIEQLCHVIILQFGQLYVMRFPRSALKEQELQRTLNSTV